MARGEMQRYLNREAQRGAPELETYRNLMDILGPVFPVEVKKEKS